MVNSTNHVFEIKRVTPPNIILLAPNEIFVFGSNEAGIHGKGAALQALKYFGAISGIGFGPQGNSFAIPSKNSELKTLSLGTIRYYIARFKEYVTEHPDKIFLVTKIGCGLAGYQPKDIAPLFLNLITNKNVYLPKEFWEILLY